MKKIIIILIIIIAPTFLFAQNKDSITFSVDTINIRGIVYNTEGHPIENMELGTDWCFPGGSSRAKTDNNGYFELKGIHPDAKIHFIDGRYFSIVVPVKGSRYVAIYLPAPVVVNSNANDSIIIEAKRISPKIKSSFKTEKSQCGFPETMAVLPQPKGGPEKFDNYIKQNLTYPESAVKNNIEGAVEVLFTVGKDGTLSNFKVVKGIGYGCDEQVISLLKKAPSWRPGVYWGRPLSVQETISVQFKLTDN